MEVLEGQGKAEGVEDVLLRATAPYTSLFLIRPPMTAVSTAASLGWPLQKLAIQRLCRQLCHTSALRYRPGIPAGWTAAMIVSNLLAERLITRMAMIRS